MKGGKTRKGETGGIAYLWNAMDRQIVKVSDCFKAFRTQRYRRCNSSIQQAIHNTRGQSPQQIHTDALRAYREGISETFGLKVDHVAKYDIINKPHADNNRIERLNGTLRES